MRHIRTADPNELPQAIAAFRELILEGEPPELTQISYALDRLTTLATELPDLPPSDSELEPPRSDPAAIYARLRTRFPTLGLYGTADPLDIDQSSPMLGDAIDDLADILRDLSEAAWRAEHIGIEEGVWYFLMHYRSHWGHHARSLGLYLHALAF